MRRENFDGGQLRLTGWLNSYGSHTLELFAATADCEKLAIRGIRDTLERIGTRSSQICELERWFRSSRLSVRGHRHRAFLDGWARRLHSIDAAPTRARR